jgi:plasmid stability protein
LFEVATLTNLTVTHLEDDVRDGLRDVANSHGRTFEEEAREILRGAVLSTRTAPLANCAAGKLGSRIAARFASAGLEHDIPEL